MCCLRSPPAPILPFLHLRGACPKTYLAEAYRAGIDRLAIPGRREVFRSPGRSCSPNKPSIHFHQHQDII